MFNEKAYYTYEDHGDIEDVYNNKVFKKKERKKEKEKKNQAIKFYLHCSSQTKKHPNLPKDGKGPSRAGRGGICL